mgnify:CR=1 FL=1
MAVYETPTLALYTPFATLGPGRAPLLVLADTAEPRRASLHARVATPPVWTIGAPPTVGSDGRQVLLMGATLDLTPLAPLRRTAPLLVPAFEMAITQAGHTDFDWLLDAAASQLAGLWAESDTRRPGVRVDRSMPGDPRIVVARRPARERALAGVWL